MSLAELGGATEALEAAGQRMGVDPALVDQLVSMLSEIHTTLSEDPYATMGTIASGSFGGNGTAENLAYHHGRAHQVMNDTLKGFMTDLHDFTTYVRKTVDLMDDTDLTQAQRSAAQQKLVSDFNALHRHAHDETNNHNSRQNTNPGPRVNGGH